MAFTNPPPYLFACFPLQEYFVNKDTGFPLASGVVEFFSDAAYTVPKNVYQQNQTGTLSNPTYEYTLLGSKLVLSSVGTFVDQNGVDIIPFLYPYTGVPPQDPTQSPQGDPQLYFIRVWNKDPSIYNDAVLQFTRQGWPPNFTSSSNLVDTFESTQNVYTNPQFNVVSFTPDPANNKFTISVTPGGVSVDIAPGWKISANTATAGDIRIRQIELNAGALTEPSYAIEIDSDVSITDLKLTQRLTQSPRMFYATYVSAFVLAKCTQSISVNVTTTYVPSNGTSKLILQGATTSDGEFTELGGVANSSVLIDGTLNVDPPSTGYVDLVTSFDSGRIMQFTSFQAITVQNPQSLVPYIQQTTPQQTNAQFWYYKPQLEYKPIPSYTLGWDFAMNPFQAEGTSGALYNITGPGKSYYVADQTILFQSTVNLTTVSKFEERVLKLAVAGGTTSLALVQYLGVNEAQELLRSPLCSQIRAKVSAGTLVGQINLYYTSDASLPTLGVNKTANCYSLVSAVNATTAAPSVGTGSYGNWTKVTRDGYGAAYFNLNTAMTSTNLAGWNESAVAGIANAKYFAIVVSFAEIPDGVNIELEHVTLQKGYIPTAPAAMSFGETLAGLEQYYSKSFAINTQPATNAGTSNCVEWSQAQLASSAGISPPIFYPTRMRVSPSVTIYNPSAANNQARNITAGDCSNTIAATIGTNNFNISFTSPGGSLVSQGVIAHWSADARYGIV